MVHREWLLEQLRLQCADFFGSGPAALTQPVVTDTRATISTLGTELTEVLAAILRGTFHIGITSFYRAGSVDTQI